MRMPDWMRPSWRRQAKAAEKLADAIVAGDGEAQDRIVAEHVAAERARRQDLAADEAAILEKLRREARTRESLG